MSVTAMPSCPPLPLSSSYWPAMPTEPVLDLSIGDLLRQATAEVPGQVALVAGGADRANRRRWTYQQLLSEAEACAARLLEHFTCGERIALYAPNQPEWVVMELGAALAGLVLVTVNPAYRATELTYVLRQSRASGVIHASEWRGHSLTEAVQQVRADLPLLRDVLSLDDWAASSATGLPTLPLVEPADPAQIEYTSGTTGFPKGALLSHRGLVTNARFCLGRLGVGPGDVYVNPMPLFHTSGCVVGVLGCIATRAIHVLVPAFEPELVLDLVEEEKATATGGAPTMLIALTEHPSVAGRDLSRVRSLLCGGAAVPPELVRRAEATFGARFSTLFGQTECSPVITQTCLDDTPEDKAGTIGRPLPQTEVKIVDPSSGDDPLPCGEIGELWTRGYHVMSGYFDMPDATAESLTVDGWLRTGDLCSMDTRGYCKVEGRLKDMVIRGGENIYPREIEDVLFTHPAVGEAAVVGVPDQRWGEQLVAFVRPVDGCRPDYEELAAYLRTRLAPYKVPRYWRTVDTFPLTPSGKVQKFVLRKEFLGDS